MIDVWIMLAMGGIGYVLRKFDFDHGAGGAGAGALADAGTSACASRWR